MHSLRTFRMFSSLLPLFFILGVHAEDTVDVFNAERTLDDWNNLLLNKDFVFVNFYADWCRFSKLLAPQWQRAASIIADDSALSPKVQFARVDCDSSPMDELCKYYNVHKYPTVTLIKHGIRGRGSEYRGSRSAEGLVDFLKAQARDTVSVVTSSDLSHSLQPRDVVPGTGEKYEKPVIIFAKVPEGHEENVDLLRKVSTHFLDTECNFHVNVVPGEFETSVISFDAVSGNEKSFPGQMQNFLELLQWARSQCVPLVRELMFENAEALTEEGLPFLVLFRDPDDEASLQIFRDIINDELLGDQDKVNFLYADGFVFEHPLKHLGKTSQDFPVIALDDFNHIFGLPTDANFEDPGVLKAFIQDLHSGKLHKDFHSGEPLAILESVFQRLVPSSRRYSVLTKDEL